MQCADEIYKIYSFRSFVINVPVVQEVQRKVSWWLLTDQMFMYILLKRLAIHYKARFTLLSCSVSQ